MATVWEGYISPRDTRVVFICFEGKRLGGLALALDDCNVECTFYRARGGRIVVHEAHLGKWGAGHPYDQAFVWIFGSLDEACERLNVDKHAVDPLRYNTNSWRVNAPDAPVVTLDEFVELLKAEEG